MGTNHRSKLPAPDAPLQTHYAAWDGQRGGMSEEPDGPPGSCHVGAPRLTSPSPAARALPEELVNPPLNDGFALVGAALQLALQSFERLVQPLEVALNPLELKRTQLGAHLELFLHDRRQLVPRALLLLGGFVALAQRTELLSQLMRACFQTLLTLLELADGGTRLGERVLRLGA
jgi:hypothetical protein